MIENKAYFEKHKYRDPADYLVNAFVAPKLKYMEDCGCFKKDDCRMLDVGSGNGTFSHYFKQYSKQVFCIDYSEQLLMANTAKHKARANAYSLPFKDNQFDLVFEANLLHHVDDPCRVVREVTRCSSGYVVLLEPNRYNPLMAAFAMINKAERGVLLSSLKRWKDVLKGLNVEIIAGMTTGMITQENTPSFMVPFLKIFDFDFFLGEYVMLIGKKR